MFRHSLNIIICGFYVIQLNYVFKLIDFSPMGRPKMHQVFEFL